MCPFLVTFVALVCVIVLPFGSSCPCHSLHQNVFLVWIPLATTYLMVARGWWECASNDEIAHRLFSTHLNVCAEGEIHS